MSIWYTALPTLVGTKERNAYIKPKHVAAVQPDPDGGRAALVHLVGGSVLRVEVSVDEALRRLDNT